MSTHTEAIETVAQTPLCDQIEGSSSQTQIEPATVFDPAPYFDQWLAHLEAIRQQLASDDSPASAEQGSDFIVESLPGSNCEVSFEGVLHFDGHSMGNIRSPGGALVVTRRGIVDANIEVAVAIINGSVNGNITASERVYLDSEAKVSGEINTPLLSVRRGANFEGDCLLTASSGVAIAEEPARKEEKQLKRLAAGA
jgi:cytoskeletal protein CcmA (bactofilin family)